MNEVVPSGVLLQRLIQNSHTDILNREKNNDRFMHLYHIGTYWVAFERSACRLCGLFPKSELSLFCVPGCPEYVVMSAEPVSSRRWGITFVSATGLPLGTPKVFADKVNKPIADYLKQKNSRNCGIVFIDFVSEPGGKDLVEYLIDSNVCAK